MDLMVKISFFKVENWDNLVPDEQLPFFDHSHKVLAQINSTKVLKFSGISQI